MTNLYYENRKVRDLIAAKMRKFRSDISGTEGLDIADYIAAQKILLDHNKEMYDYPENFGRANTEEMKEEGFQRMLDASCAECPPLPCGEDDAWFERNEQAYNYGRDLVETAVWLEAGEIKKGRQPRNPHAFDEWYFGDRVQ